MRGAAEGLLRACRPQPYIAGMSERAEPLREIERLLTQVVVALLTLAAASLTRRGIYRHDPDAIEGGFYFAAIWIVAIAIARYRQGPDAWWLLVSGLIVLALPVTVLVNWATA